MELEHKSTVLPVAPSDVGISFAWSKPEWSTRLKRIQAGLVFVEELDIGILLLSPPGALLPGAGDAFDVHSVRAAINDAFQVLTAECPLCNGLGNKHNCQKAHDRCYEGGCVGSLITGDQLHCKAHMPHFFIAYWTHFPLLAQACIRQATIRTRSLL